ncbi:hypothetical protein FRB93_006561 [Tulasnella sp. JGI-2019a]|nr:hypothetical protein FRB93_006561 [Tulasnella sp. JGI-2019a]
MFTEEQMYELVEAIAFHSEPESLEVFYTAAYRNAYDDSHQDSIQGTWTGTSARNMLCLLTNTKEGRHGLSKGVTEGDVSYFTTGSASTTL